jgi:hypothetical protein
MPISIKSMITYGCLAAVAALVIACSPRPVPALTVADLMEDRVLLDGALMKCNRTPAASRSNSECANARIAIARLAAQADPAEEAKHAEEFEHSREQLRMAQDKRRREQEARTPKMDAYSLPVIPVDPVRSPKDEPQSPPKDEPQSPTVSQTKP